MKAMTKSKRLMPEEWIFGIVTLVGIVVAGGHTMLGIYPLALVAGLASLVGILALATDHVGIVARAFRRELARLSRIPPLGGMVTLRALRTSGDCAWGYKASDVWSVSRDGAVSPPLCRAAAEGLAPWLASIDHSGQGSGDFVCACPLTGHKVVFSVRARDTLKVAHQHVDAALPA